MRLPNHHRDPLRRIVKREMQNGKPFVVLVCKHAMPGVPISRYSKFYPCTDCGDEVARFRKERTA